MTLAELIAELQACLPEYADTPVSVKNSDGCWADVDSVFLYDEDDVEVQIDGSIG